MSSSLTARVIPSPTELRQTLVPTGFAGPAQPFLALLPGRVRWLLLCHDRPAECKVCLRALAQLLAEEMEFVLFDAQERAAGWYQAQLSGWPCTLDQAEELRRMTAGACWREALGDYKLQLVQVRHRGLDALRLMSPGEFEAEPGAAEFEDVAPPHWVLRGFRIAAFSVAALVLLSLACL